MPFYKQQRHKSPTSLSDIIVFAYAFAAEVGNEGILICLVYFFKTMSVLRGSLSWVTIFELWKKSGALDVECISVALSWEDTYCDWHCSVCTSQLWERKRNWIHLRSLEQGSLCLDEKHTCSRTVIGINWRHFMAFYHSDLIHRGLTDPLSW